MITSEEEARSSQTSLAGSSKDSGSAYLEDIIYLSGSTHPETAEPIIVFSLAALSDVPDNVSDEELFAGLLARCTAWVKEDDTKGYVLVILASEGEETRRSRGRAFWIWRWRNIPRSFKKNLKRMYIVHPTGFTKTILNVVLPFLSPKAYRKIYPVDSLVLLHRHHSVSLAGMRLTIPLLRDESSLMVARPDLFPEASRATYAWPRAAGSWYTGLQGLLGAAASYLPYPSTDTSPTYQAGPSRGYFGRIPEDLVAECDSVPVIMSEMREAILAECSKSEGIFRMTPGAALRPPLIALLALPIASQPAYPWPDIARSDPYLLPKLLMRIFSSSPTPFISSDLYPIIRGIQSAKDIPNSLCPALSPARVLLLRHTIQSFRLLSAHVGSTRMSARAYAICFAPDLLRGPNPVDDLEMCLEPGKRLPSAMQGRGASGGAQGNTLVGVLEAWINDGSVDETGQVPGVAVA